MTVWRYRISIIIIIIIIVSVIARMYTSKRRLRWLGRLQCMENVKHNALRWIPTEKRKT